MAIDLKKLIVTDSNSLSVNVEFKDSIILTLNYVSRIKLQSLWKSCTTLKFDRTTRQRTPQVDGTRFSEEFSRLAVSGWRGVTPRAIAASLFPLDLSGMSEAEKDAEIPFTHENLSLLLSNSYELDTFIQDSAVDSALFKPEHEGELGNSGMSQSGSSIETTSPATNA